MNQIDLNGQTAVVTGGAQGLGFAIASRLLASGATVSLWDIDQAALDKAQAALGGKVSSEIADITDLDALAAAACPRRSRARPCFHPGQLGRYCRAQCVAGGL